MNDPQPVTLKELVGKRVLIGITRLDHQDKFIRQEQHHGCVTRADSTIRIRLSTGRDLELPPHTSSFRRAAPGEYRLRSTGEVVVDPDYTTAWTINSPPPDWKPEKSTDSPAAQ